jgi:hypothetical protein
LLLSAELACSVRIERIRRKDRVAHFVCLKGWVGYGCQVIAVTPWQKSLLEMQVPPTIKWQSGKLYRRDQVTQTRFKKRRAVLPLRGRELATARDPVGNERRS